MTASGLATEALWALTQWCTWALLGPMLITLAAWRGHIATAAMLGAAAWIGTGARLSGWLPAVEDTATLVMTLVAAAIGIWFCWYRKQPSPLAAAAAAIAVGVIASMSWEPCVGSDLGAVFTDWDDDPIRSWVALGWYQLVLFGPIWLLSAASKAIGLVVHSPDPQPPAAPSAQSPQR